MTTKRWVAADREAEVCAAERDVESVGLGPPVLRELVGGGVAVLDAAGRVHAVIGWATDGAGAEAKAA